MEQGPNSDKTGQHLPRNSSKTLDNTQPNHYIYVVNLHCKIGRVTEEHMIRTGLTRSGGLAAMVGGFVSALLGLLYALLAKQEY